MGRREGGKEERWGSDSFNNDDTRLRRGNRFKTIFYDSTPDYSKNRRRILSLCCAHRCY